MIAQRDAFIDVIYDAAQSDPNLIFLSADFGAPALDRFRNDLPEQFVHLGISEQNMMDVAIGLSLRGKKVFAYAMAPFVTFRAAEQHKIAAMMGANICVIVAGVGLGYANAGPTHYATEEFLMLNSIIGGSVYTASDAAVAKEIAKSFINTPSFCFVRLDREVGPELGSGDSIFRVIRQGLGQRFCVVSQGYASRLVNEWLDDDFPELTHVDVIKAKPLDEPLIQYLQTFEKLLVIDEQVPNSSLGTLLAGIFAHDPNDSPSLKSMALTDCYMYENTGRRAIAEKYGLGRDIFLANLKSVFGGEVVNS